MGCIFDDESKQLMVQLAQAGQVDIQQTKVQDFFVDFFATRPPTASIEVKEKKFSIDMLFNPEEGRYGIFHWVPKNETEESFRINELAIFGKQVYDEWYYAEPEPEGIGSGPEAETPSIAGSRTPIVTPPSPPPPVTP